jgi:8-oxo-dGTP diphosphatase
MTDGLPPKVTRVAAYALVEDRDGRLLLCRMAPGQPGAGKWTLPGGGLEFGEAPEVGVLRELSEETGLEGRILEIVGVTNRALRIARPTGDHHMHALGICYRVQATGGTLRDEPDGSTDRTGWFTRAEIAQLPVTHLVTSALEFLSRG